MKMFGIYNNTIQIKNSSNGSEIVFTKYSTYQITIDKSNPDMPTWNVDLLTNQSGYPQNAVMLPEECNADAFNTPLDGPSLMVTGAAVAPPAGTP